MTSANLNPVVAEVTARIVHRSRESRAAYLDQITDAGDAGAPRGKLSCANFAHAFAASSPADKLRALDARTVNIGIVTAYNDMLSAHQPYETYPQAIRDAAREVGATAQVAGGVPAMCDGVTQGRPGMELSLFSRDVIAMSAGIALTHDAFDAALMLGICDKIVPGLVIGALSFGHLPVIFLPAGPMTSGVSNAEKARTRNLYAEGKVDRDALLASEMAAYHGPGTCTFYGTANSNQMMMEMMGLHLPGAAFVTPGTPLRDALTRAATQSVAELARSRQTYTPMGRVVDEKAIVNAAAGLLATGGSTNHTLHLVAMARAAGVQFTWDDFDQLSSVTPLIAKVYPNGSEDVNAFHAAGGMGFVIRELLGAGLAHDDVITVAGPGLHRYAQEPWLDEGRLAWRDSPAESLNRDILRPASDPLRPPWGPAPAQRQSGPGHRQGVGGEARPADRRGALRRVRRPGRPDRGLPAGRAEPRPGGRGPLPGPPGQRHAGAAQSQSRPGRADGARLSGCAGHRRAHVRRLGQGSGGAARDA